MLVDGCDDPDQSTDHADEQNNGDKRQGFYHGDHLPSVPDCGQAMGVRFLGPPDSRLARQTGNRQALTAARRGEILDTLVLGIWHPDAQTGRWAYLSQESDFERGVVSYFTDGELVKEMQMDDSGRLVPTD